MRTELTDRQKEILDFIRDFTHGNGYPPTMREIGGHFGFMPRAATNHVNALVRKGYISKQPLKSRSLTVAGHDAGSRTQPRLGGAPLQKGLKSRSMIVADHGRADFDHANSNNLGLDKHGFARRGWDKGDLRKVPIVGRVAAGEPILAVENIEGAVMLPAGWAQADDCFLLRVEGDSMVDAHICSGDYVLVKRQPIAESGEIVVALLGDEATVKRFIIKKDRIVLKPENKNMEPIHVKSGDKSFRIIGKVIGVWRSI
ncbi:transcriptional repressor LexA [Candidatus Poribacteria bacterium]|nr:transcriptional repressor LexA [Candidatus Poribacteria bacterium]